MSVRVRSRGQWVTRCELQLARPPYLPLGEPGPKQDTMAQFARVYAGLGPGEDARVAIDLLPYTAHEARRARDRLLRQADPGANGNSSLLGELGRAIGEIGRDVGRELGLEPRNTGRPAARRGPVETIARRQQVQALHTKLQPEALFEAQVLLRASSPSRAGADAIMTSLLGCFAVFYGENWWKVRGTGLLGRWFVGADAPWRRRWFDLRMDTGLFRPGSRRHNILTAREIAWALTPPTRHCPERNVARLGPGVAPAPRDLPRYPQDPAKRRPGVLPLGLVSRHGRQTLVGIRLSEFLFGGMFGRTGHGKTEQALVQVVHVARVEGKGLLLFDPHRTGITRVRPYLTEVADRVVELDLAHRGLDARHVAWNLLDVHGLDDQRIQDRADAVIDAIAIGARWTAGNAGRSLAILTNAVHSLLELGKQLPPELCPTIFTIPRLLLDEDWRAAILPRLPDDQAWYWSDVYRTYGSGAAGPLCQLISRLAANPTVKATFGAPVSTYDPRTAIDTQRVVLACPPSISDTLVCNLIMQGHLDAARQRNDPPPEQHVYWIFDEAQIYDGASVSPRGPAIAEMLEQTRKYGVRAIPMTQSPLRLSEATREALSTNASLLITATSGPNAARFFADQWADDNLDAKRAVQRLRKHHYLCQPTHHGRRVDPFRLAGVPLEYLWGDHHHPERLNDLEAIVDQAYRPYTVGETLELVDGHDDRIAVALGGVPPSRGVPEDGEGDDELEIRFGEDDAS